MHLNADVSWLEAGSEALLWLAETAKGPSDGMSLDINAPETCT